MKTHSAVHARSNWNLQQHIVCMILLNFVTGVVPLQAVEEEPDDWPGSYKVVFGDENGLLSQGLILASAPRKTISAAALLQDSVTRWKMFFNNRLITAGGYRSMDNEFAEVPFEAQTVDGTRIVGVVNARVKSGGGLILVGMGDKRTFPTSVLPALRAAGQPQAPVEAAIDPDNVQWMQTQAPDGSASAMIPAGWQVTSGGSGSLIVKGDAGEMVAMGMQVPVCIPGHEETARFTGAPVIAFGAASRVFPHVIAWASQRSKMTRQPYARNVKVVGAEKVRAPGDWEVFGYSFDWIIGGQSVPYAGAALARTGTVGAPGGYMFFLTSYEAPVAQFASRLPLMQRIHATWGINPSVLQERMSSAAKSILAKSGIIQAANAERQRVFERVNADWSEYFRGEGTIANSATGELKSGNLSDCADIVKELNRQAGSEQFKVIPLKDLIAP